MSCIMYEQKVAELNILLEGKSVEYILQWTWENFNPKLVATSSFQTQSGPLLHIISETIPDLNILFLDTGFHFSETLSFRDRLINEFNLNVTNLTARMGHDGFRQQYGNLYKNDPDLCCYINKVEPLQQAKANLDAWISGIRRDQTDNRSNTPLISIQKDGTYKICPMVNWTKQDIHNYNSVNKLPTHPLSDEGYTSIGCAPCTRPVKGSDNERAGRWTGLDKTECGVNFDND